MHHPYVWRPRASHRGACSKNGRLQRRRAAMIVPMGPTHDEEAALAGQVRPTYPGRGQGNHRRSPLILETQSLSLSVCVCVCRPFSLTYKKESPARAWQVQALRGLGLPQAMAGGALQDLVESKKPCVVPIYSHVGEAHVGARVTPGRHPSINAHTCPHPVKVCLTGPYGAVRDMTGCNTRAAQSRAVL